MSNQTEDLTDEQIKDLENLDNEEMPKEKAPRATKVEKTVKIPENENPSLTKALAEFRERIGKPTKGCEKLVNAVIHKRSYNEGTLTSKPFIQFFDKREYDNFLKHPNGFVVELEIHNPFK